MKAIKIIICVFTAIVLCACAFAPSFALAPESTRVYEGIDVSVFQGDIDFERVRESQIEVVYIRAAFGVGDVDERFEENARKVKEAGLRFGFYFFVTARTPYEAELQGRYFAELIKGKDYDCRPAMDFEDFSGLSRAEVRSIGLAFIRALEEQTRVKPLLYSDAYAASYIWGEEFASYPLWVADYGPTEPDVTGEVWSGWSGFQYSDRGRIGGINGNVDLDKFTSRVFLTEEERANRCK